MPTTSALPPPFDASKMSDQPEKVSSPILTSHKPSVTASSSPIVPLDSGLRTTPIHPSLVEVKVPSSADAATYTYHPATLVPFTPEDLAHYKLAQLQKQHPTAEAALQAQEEAVREVKARIEEGEAKRRDVERDMEAKEKTRQWERNAYWKRSGKGEG